MKMSLMRGVTVGGVLGIGIVIYFLSAIIPGAFDNFFNSSTENWDAGTAALWTLIPLAVIALLVLVFVPGRGRGGT